MKATVFYKDLGETKIRRKTIEVEKNDPVVIVKTFLNLTEKSFHTYVDHIKCGRYDYQWKDTCVCEMYTY